MFLTDAAFGLAEYVVLEAGACVLLGCGMMGHSWQRYSNRVA